MTKFAMQVLNAKAGIGTNDKFDEFELNIFNTCSDSQVGNSGNQKTDEFLNNSKHRKVTNQLFQILKHV